MRKVVRSSLRTSLGGYIQKKCYPIVCCGGLLFSLALLGIPQLILGSGNSLNMLPSVANLVEIWPPNIGAGMIPSLLAAVA